MTGPLADQVPMCAGKHGDGPHLVRVVRYLTVVMPVSANQMSRACQVFCVRLWFMLSGRGVRGR